MFFGSFSKTLERMGVVVPDGPCLPELPEDDVLIGDVKVFIREKKEIAKEAIIERAYDMDYKLGEVTENTLNTGEKIYEGVRKIATTANNPSIRGKIVDEDDLCAGDHIFVKRGYTHHAIYVGNGEVIHYTPEDSSICIREDSLDCFSSGSKIYRVSHSDSPCRYSGAEVVSRAREKLNEEDYNLLFNNCEHFARWCRFDK